MSEWRQLNQMGLIDSPKLDFILGFFLKGGFASCMTGSGTTPFRKKNGEHMKQGLILGEKLKPQSKSHVVE